MVYCQSWLSWCVLAGIRASLPKSLFKATLCHRSPLTPLFEPNFMLTPLQRYKMDLQNPDFHHDAAQEEAVRHLDDIYHQLVAPQPKKTGWFRRRVERPSIQGLYMWGGVGRGKTYLMDVFFDSLPFAAKQRLHFHRFMRYIHGEMKARQGESNPLVAIAKDFAKTTRVLCFDEFFVTDITDAMILAGLLETLFEEGVVLVATSNIVPDDLYYNGLQRARFLPAIELLKQHTTVLNVDGGTDYRLRLLEQAELFHFPLDEAAQPFLEERFKTLNSYPENARDNVRLAIEGRPIKAVKAAPGIAWFEFLALCDGPRSQNDYIQLASEYHTLLLANVPVMDGKYDDQCRRFINLVDEMYDRNVKLLITAEAGIDDLYAGGRLEFEFARTRSRLLEMQSTEFLEREHKPE